MGIGLIRSVFEFWRPILDLGPDQLTTDMARKTFVTFGVKYTERDQISRVPVLFKIPAAQLMEVTHHQSPAQFQCYVVNAAWRDPEAEAHPARTFSLWAQDHYKPPITNSVPDALGRMKDSNDTAFGSLHKVQATISQNIFVDPQGDPDHPLQQGRLS